MDRPHPPDLADTTPPLVHRRPRHPRPPRRQQRPRQPPSRTPPLQRATATTLRALPPAADAAPRHLTPMVTVIIGCRLRRPLLLGRVTLLSPYPRNEAEACFPAPAPHADWVTVLIPGRKTGTAAHHRRSARRQGE